jgi:stalled ribosome rescue protein Dom34
MSAHFHAIVWIDHREAKILPFSATDVQPLVVNAKGSGRHLQHKANVPGSGHKGVDKEFFERVIDGFNDFGAILLTGPGNTRLELKNFIDEHHPNVAQRISAVEPLDHPSDAALLALGRKFFKADDRMHPQTPV